MKALRYNQLSLFSLLTFFLLFGTISSAQQSKDVWQAEFDFGDGVVFSTFLNVDKGQNDVVMTSPKNADIRLFGQFKSRLGRLFGKLPKKGIFVTINTKQIGDSIIGTANVPMLGEMLFKGSVIDDLLSAELIKSDTILVGTLKGIKTQKSKIDYTYIYPKILKTTQDNIYSKEVLQTKTWQKFDKKLKKLCHNAQDDIEFFLGFNMLTSKLEFSHYNLLLHESDKENDTTEVSNKKSTLVFEKKSPSTYYLRIKNFSTSQEELAEVLPRIVKDNPKNLIIDLRDNGGGGIEAAFEFAKHLISTRTEVGYFVTNKLQNSGFDSVLFNTLPDVIPQTTDEFIEGLKRGKGAKLVFQKSNNPVFLGKLYILINSNTASTCEPIVYLLKQSKRAIVIGENTAGAMLSASVFEVSGKYKLFLPLADFYTYDGKRLEGVGVAPDIEVESEKALEKVLEIIEK